MRPVALLVFLLFSSGILLTSCRKEQPKEPVISPYISPYPKNHTSGMKGERLWVGKYTTGFFPTTELADTQHYAVNILNDSTVMILTDTFHYQSIAADSSMFFKRNRGTATRDVSVSYYFSADSMVYNYYDRFSSCCFTSRQLHTIK